MESKVKNTHYVTDLESLRGIFNSLKEKYKIVAPTVRDGVILYSKVENFQEIAFGYRNVETPGSYQLEGVEGYFTYTHPANSLKEFVHPKELEILRIKRVGEDLIFEVDYPRGGFCFFDVRACDLMALEILDRVFVKNNKHKDPYYKSLREDNFILAVNCTYTTHTCFCSTMGTGPEVMEGYDILITELDDSFLISIGSEKGRAIVESIENKRIAEEKHLAEKDKKIQATRNYMAKAFNVENLSERLYSKMDSSYWEYIEKRCLSCTSCTQSCPTCFCFDILEKNNLDLNQSERVRVWDSCFSPSFAVVHRFNLRQSIHSRYRQWLMHKFAYWVDQFRVFGCVGCGRCITWCPVGIDIRQEVKKIAGS